MLGLLVDYGLTDRVCKIYEVTDADLEQLALLEMESRQLAETAKRDQNNGSS